MTRRSPGRVSLTCRYFHMDDGSNSSGSLYQLVGRSRESLRAVFIVAHPDDEVIGAGGYFRQLIAPRFYHVTDGSPLDLQDARRNGYDSREAYASARRRELYDVLTKTGIPHENAVCLGYIDQQAAFFLSRLTDTIATLLKHLPANIVLTHPYEGGHPDHDATAFAVHMACRRLRQTGIKPPTIIEMGSFYNRADPSAPYRFPSMYPGREVRQEVTGQQLAFKRALLASFRTQQHVLQYVPAHIEYFRIAPEYRFERPPHTGPFQYERFDWNMTMYRWLELTKAATSQLERRTLSSINPVTSSMATFL